MYRPTTTAEDFKYLSIWAVIGVAAYAAGNFARLFVFSTVALSLCVLVGAIVEEYNNRQMAMIRKAREDEIAARPASKPLSPDHPWADGRTGGPL